MGSTNPIPIQQTPPHELHRMVVLQPGEKVICEITRHPCGIIGQYIAASFGIVIAAILVYLFSTQYGGSSAQLLLYVVFGILVVGLVVLVGAATKVYWGNHWIITSDSLTQINQSSPFGVQVSELSLENLEDVTVNQAGMLPHMFNYGTLRAETAGERSKFSFSYCPNPHEYARLIIDAREKFVQGPPPARQQVVEQASSGDVTTYKT
jgi:hypothetical protein